MSEAAPNIPMDIWEQDARIRQLQADVLLRALDCLKRVWEVRFGPSQLVFTNVAAVAALFGAAIAPNRWLAN